MPASASGSGSGSGSARLFAALRLPEDVQRQLRDWAEGRWATVPGTRVLDADSLHVTLCFLGSIDMGEADAIGTAVADATAEVGGPLVLGLGEVVALPARRPRVGALTLVDADGRAGALQAALAARLEQGGWYAPERRRWLAHVSVVRLGRSGGGVAVPSSLVSSSSPAASASPVLPSLGPFAASAVVLLRSWPGSRYEPLRCVAL